jgi:hypothetical protein
MASLQAMVSLRGRSFGSLQRRISRLEAHTSPAAKTKNACDPCAVPTLPFQGREYGCIIRRRRPPFNLSAFQLVSTSGIQHFSLSAFQLLVFARGRSPTAGRTIRDRSKSLRISSIERTGWRIDWLRCGGKHGDCALNCWRFAPVAQGIEQRFPKPRVGGSNPSRRARELPANCGKMIVSRFSPEP